MHDCPHCGEQFIPGEFGDMQRQMSCPNCGNSLGHRPYRDQPSPVQDEMHERNMPEPGMSDVGGNPLQEGTFKGVGGWKNPKVRDESFASVRQANEFSLGLGPNEAMGENFGDTRTPSRSWLLTSSGHVYDTPYPGTHEQIAQTLGDPNLLQTSTVGHFYEPGTAQVVGHNNSLSPKTLESYLSSYYGSPVDLTGNFASREENLGAPGTGSHGDIAYPWWEKADPGFGERQQQEQGPTGYYDNPYFNRGGRLGRLEPLDQTIHMPWSHVAQEEQQEPEFPAEQMDVAPPGPPTTEAQLSPSGFHPSLLNGLSNIEGLGVNGQQLHEAKPDLAQNFSPYGDRDQWLINRQSPVMLSHSDPEKLEVAKQMVESGSNKPYLDYVDYQHPYKDVVQPQVPFSDPNVHKGVGNINPLIEGRPYRQSMDSLRRSNTGSPVQVAARTPEELELTRGLLHSGDLSPLIQYRQQQMQPQARTAGMMGTLGSVAGGLIGTAVTGGNPVGGMIGSGIGGAAGNMIGGGGGGGGDAGGGGGALPETVSAFGDHLDTPSSVDSIGAKDDDPEKVDQKEFDAGPDMHNNLYDPSVETGAGGTTTGKGLDPEGKAAKTLLDNLPTFLSEAVGNNHNHPLIIGLRNDALAENPNLDSEAEGHHQAIKDWVQEGVTDNFYKRHADHESRVKRGQVGAALASLASSAKSAAPGLAKGAMQNAPGKAAQMAAGSLGNSLGGGGGGGAPPPGGGGDSGGLDDGGGGAPPGPSAPDDSMPPPDEQIATSKLAMDPAEEHLDSDEPDYSGQHQETEPSGTVDPQGRGVSLIIANLPEVLQHYFSPETGIGDPKIEMIDQALQSEDPDWENNTDEDHPSIADFFKQLLGDDESQDSEHHPSDNDQMDDQMDNHKSTKRYAQHPQLPGQQQPGMQQPGGTGQGQPSAAPPSAPGNMHQPDQSTSMPQGAPGIGGAGAGGAPGGAPAGGAPAGGAPGMGGGGMGGPAPFAGGGHPGAGDMAQPDQSTSMGAGGQSGAGDMAQPDQSTSMGMGGHPGAGDMAQPDQSTSMGAGGQSGAGDMAQPDQSSSMGAGGQSGAGDMAQPDQSTSMGMGAGGAGGGAGGGMAPPGPGTAPPGGPGMDPQMLQMQQQQQKGGGWHFHLAQDPAAGGGGMDPEQLLQLQQNQNTQQAQQQQQQHQQAPNDGPAAQEQQAAQVWQALTPDPGGKASLPPSRPRDDKSVQDSTPAGVVVPQGMQGPMPQQPGVGAVPQVPPAPGNPMHQFMTSRRRRRGSMGPDSPEQQQQVIDYLLENGRQDEAPEVPTNPDKFAQELALVQRKDYHPLPNEQADQQPQPAQEEAPPGDTMPVPNMQVQQSMRSALRRFAQPQMVHAPGDNGAYPDRDGSDNPMLSPAADQDQGTAPNLEGQQDSSMTWVDGAGNPLQPGELYEMSSRSYDIPDVIRVTTVRPDSISYELEGQYNIQHETELTKEEADVEGIQFSQATQGAGDPEGDQQPDPDFSRQPGEGNDMNQASPDQDDLSSPHMKMTRRTIGRPEDDFGSGDPVFHPDFGYGTIQQPNVNPPYHLPPNLPNEGPYHHVQFAQNGPMAATVVDDQRLQPGSPTEPQWEGAHTGAAPAMMYDQDLPPSIPEGMTHEQFNQQGRPEDPNAVGHPSAYCPSCGQSGLTPDTPCPNCGAISQPEQNHVDWLNNRPEGHRGHRLADDFEQFDSSTPESTRPEDYGGSGRNINDIQDRKLRELQLQLEDATRNGDYNAVPQIQMMIDRIQAQLGRPADPPQPQQQAPPTSPQPQDPVQDPQPVVASNADWLREGGDFTKQAGAKYTPMEEREFVTEPGRARNIDKMNLAGTHYLDDEHDMEDELFLGL